jgi:hypothetical protein
LASWREFLVSDQEFQFGVFKSLASLGGLGVLARVSRL